MMTRCFLALLLAACAAVAGCSAQDHIQQGDQAAALLRHGEAARYYQEALGVEAKLAQDPAFLAKLHHAQSRAAFEEGQALARQQAWDQAVDKLAQAARIDPSFQEAVAALAQTRRDASRWHLERALAEADRGQLDAALTHARRAAEFDPASDAAKQAAASGQDGAALPAPAGDLFRQGTAAWQDKRWPEAVAALEQVRGAAPHHLLTRVRLQQAQTQWDQARRLAGEGRTHLEAGRLDQALTALKKSLEFWPSHEQAKVLLAQATQRAAEVERLADQARQLTAEQRYDEAIAAARGALAIWPTHGPAQEVAGQARRGAAEAQLATGQAHLTAGRLDEAEAAFARALGYTADLRAARVGLGQAAMARARAAQDKGLHGIALLWWQEAGERFPADGRPDLAARMTQTRGQLAGKLGMTLAVRVADPAGRLSSDAAVLENKLMAELTRLRPAYVTLLPASDRRRAPTYVASAALVGFDLAERQTGAEDRVHSYVQRVPGPNPEIPRLQGLLVAAQADLEALRREYARLCRSCAGQGTIVCTRCGGDGLLVCQRCGGAGTIEVNNVERSCTGCRGQGTIRCPNCTQGRARCNACKGTGRAGTVTERDVRDKAEEVERLKQALATAPPVVALDVVAQWPYRVQRFTKSGKLVVRLDVKDGASGAAADSAILEKAANHEDTQIAGANPRIGLAEDKLELPSDDEVRQALFGQAAQDAAARTLAAIAGARSSQLLSEARQQEARGETVEALETRVCAAVALEPVQPEEAARLLKALRQRLTGAAAARP